MHVKRTLPLSLTFQQMEMLRKHCKSAGIPYNIDEITKTYQFWVSNISMGSHYDRDEKNINQTNVINNVLFNKAPELMFADLNLMKERLDKFFKLGFINKVDKFQVFQTSPYGWFLQDWKQFMLKFNFIQFRIMPWLLHKQDDPYPTPHPLIKVSSALELPYVRIKARYLWVSSAGIGPPKLNEKGGDILKHEVILKNLLLTNSAYFVKTTVPGAKTEEYDFFEKFIAHHELPEDAIMSDLAELTPQTRSDYLEEHDDENIREFAKVRRRKID